MTDVFSSKSKFKRKKHTMIRYYDRTTMVHSVKQIEAEILKKGDNIYWAKRLTQNKSLVYVEIDYSIYKCIWARDKKNITTFFKLKEDFTFEHLLFLQDKAYNVKIYPDCFVETNNKGALTRIKDITANKDIPYNHPLFSDIFDITFDVYKEDKKEVSMQ